MKTNLLVLGLSTFLFPAISNANECENNVDKLQLFYINGMFTSFDGASDNLASLERFQERHLYPYEKLGAVEYAYNFDEGILLQIAEVAFHKMTDYEKESEKGKFLKAIITGSPFNGLENLAELFGWFYSEIVEDVDSIMGEFDYTSAKTKLGHVLGYCARTILVTHSQGNFYGNAVYSELGYTYSYPNGTWLSDYPMLGYIGIANPSHSVGGPYGEQNRDIAKTFTNANDLIMLAVREAFGAVPADPVFANLLGDVTGHSLEQSYLENRGAPIIAQHMLDIVENLTPIPLFEQNQTSSSAISNIGYSEVSQILDVRFKYGGGYRYTDVPSYIANPFINASSHGGYFNEFIKDHYAYEKIEN